MRFVGRDGAAYVDLNEPLALGLGSEQGVPCHGQGGNQDARHPGQCMGTGCFFPEVSQGQLGTDSGWKEETLVAAWV